MIAVESTSMASMIASAYDVNGHLLGSWGFEQLCVPRSFAPKHSNNFGTVTASFGDDQSPFA